MKIYKSNIVKEIESFYGDLLYRFDNGITIHQYLKLLARKLWEGIEQKVPVLEYEIKNYHPKYIGGNGNSFFDNDLKKKDARLTIAREFGFKKWKKLKNLGNQKIDIDFENTVEKLLNGDLQGLEENLIEHPDLINKRSKYGHRASLLHYVASNGVEMWRQRVLENLPEITQCLLDYGADKRAKMKAYGGDFDTIALFESSAHPYDAGVGEKVLKILS